MSVQIARRIKKVEEAAATRQPANRPPKILFSPVGGDAEAEARYHSEVEQAVRDGFFVIKIVSLQPKAMA